MAKIKFKSELPRWYFKKDRYAWLKGASLQYLADQWSIRVAAYRDLEGGKLDSEFLHLIYENYEYGQMKVRDPSPFHSEMLMPLSEGDVLLVAHRNNIASLNINSIKESLNYSLSPHGIIVELMLRDFTDSEVIDELKRLLPEMRKKVDMPEPKLFRMEGQIRKLRVGGVFEFTDLFLWAKFNKKTIQYDLYASVIKPGTYTSDSIYRNLKKDAEAMLTTRFTDLLEAESLK